MIVKSLSVGALQTNCYVIAESAGGEGAIIDPGGDASQIVDAADGLIVRYVIDTHAHFDHILGNGEVMSALRERQDTPPELIVHPQAATLLATDGGASQFGLYAPPSPQPDRFVNDGDTLALGTLLLEVLHTPGHSAGSICLYCAAKGVLFDGDVLFYRGIGRYDLRGGNKHTLFDSIKQRLFALPDDTVVYPGHGPSTTIGEERRNKPFLRA